MDPEIKAVIYNNQKKVDMFVDTRDARGRAVIFGNFPTGKGGGPITIKSICSKWTLCP